MSRPLFLTGRKEIARSHITVRLIEEADKPPRFEAAVDLSSYDLPEDASLILEAYHKAYLRRFIAGSLAVKTLTHADVLDDLEAGDRPLFRAKVVAASGTALGCLLAAADMIRPMTADDVRTAGSLLPLVSKPRSQMGDEFWKVVLVEGDEALPELWINGEVQGLYGALLNQDPRVTALIMPEVLRQVLRGLVEDEVEWTEEGVLGRWLQMAQRFWPDQFEPWDSADQSGSQQLRREWVDQVVQKFATAHRFFESYHARRESTSEEDMSHA